MKKMIFGLLVALIFGATSLMAQSQSTTATELSQMKQALQQALSHDSLMGVQLLSSSGDTVALPVNEKVLKALVSQEVEKATAKAQASANPQTIYWKILEDLILPIVVIAFIFGAIPIGIVLCFYFAYKRRKGSEKPQPVRSCAQELDSSEEEVQAGIRQMALGLGLMIFLWLLTKESAMVAIGVLILFLGAGRFFSGYLKGGLEALRARTKRAAAQRTEHAQRTERTEQAPQGGVSEPADEPTEDVVAEDAPIEVEAEEVSSSEYRAQ